MTWVSPALKCVYGPYFKPDAAEQLQVVQTVQAAMGAPNGTALVTKRAALEKIAPIFGIENIDAALDALEEEQAANDQREADKAAQQAENDAKALHAAAGLKSGAGKPGTPGQSGGPQKAAPDRSGGARPAPASKT